MTDAWRTWCLLRRLRTGTRAAPAALLDAQNELLKRAVAHAARHVPFYRRYWPEHGFAATGFRGLADLERIPIVDSRTMKEAARSGELLADGLRSAALTYLDSSGSSGSVTRIWKGPEEERVRRAVGLRIWLEHGFRWQDVTAQFQIRPGPHLFLQRLGVSRKTWITTAQPLAHQRAQFLAARARVVAGTPTALRAICGALRAADARPARPRVVFAAGEILDAATRRLVRETLGCEPVAIYGQTEVGYVAWQCERRQDFHINADTHLVETRGPDGPAAPGKLGRVVITDLRCRTMPFLRYDTGDLAIAAQGVCPCGRTLPTLATFEGRLSGALVLDSGAILTPRRLLDALADALPPESYRIEQKTPHAFRMVFLENVDEGRRAAALAILRELLGTATIHTASSAGWAADGTGKTHAVAGPAWPSAGNPC
ncbi:MAG: phenylacetate--CoA ligase family protein [Deltaproteobacteria bacterium]|nr:phenylacetate--CoA ligase family protein [Deltaproteobacteria bacterium]